MSHELKINNLFLIGAGFTKAIFENAPINADLLEKLIEASYQPPVLQYYMTKYDTNDIEILLTLLDLEISNLDEKPKPKDKRDPTQDRSTINEQLADYFGNFRFQESILESKNWLETIALKIFSENDAIVNLNYDCFLEGLLDYFEVWSPNGGYANIYNDLADSLPSNQKGMKIFKIHGSENFVESSTLPYKEQRSVSFFINSTLYPRSGLHRHFGGGIIDPKAYLIAPSFVKIPHVLISDMMVKLLGVSKLAKNMIIIGCGLRPEDSFLKLLLTTFLNRRPEKDRKLIIISPSAGEIIEKIHKYWIGDLKKIVKLISFSSGLEYVITELTELVASPSGD